jgi:hypothetical protein
MAVPPLLDLLRPKTKSPNGYLAQTAPPLSVYDVKDVLARIGSRDPASAPLFVAALKDSDENARSAAARSLGESGALADDAVPALVRALHDNSYSVQEAATAALGQAGAAAKGALTELVAVLRDPKGLQRSDTLTAVRKIAEGLQDSRDISKNALLASALSLLNGAGTDGNRDSWRNELRLLKRSVDALQAIEKEVLARGPLPEPDLDAPIEDLQDLDLSASAIVVDGKTASADALLTRGADNLVRVNQKGASLIDRSEGIVTAVVKSTGKKIMLIKEQGMLRLYRPYKKSYALLIAISDYPSDSGYARLPQAVQQARELERTLQAQGFEVLPPLYNQQATAENIRSALRNSPATNDDRLFVYFGGHGDDVPAFGGERFGYIVPYGATKLDLPEKGIPLEELRTSIAKLLLAKQVLFALDSCQSGLVASRESDKAVDERLRSLHDIETMSRRPGRMFLTAGSGGQVALDVNGGIFTEALIEAIQGKIGDVPLGVVTLYRLYDYIRSKVYDRAKFLGHQQEPAMDVPLGSAGWVFVVDTTLVP